MGWLLIRTRMFQRKDSLVGVSLRAAPTGLGDGWDGPRTALRLSWANDLRPLRDEANCSNVFRARLGSLPRTAGSGFLVSPVPESEGPGAPGDCPLFTVRCPLEKRSNVFRARLGSLPRTAGSGFLVSPVPESEGPGAPGDCPLFTVHCPLRSARTSSVLAWDRCPGAAIRGLRYPRSPKARDRGHPATATAHCFTVHCPLRSAERLP